MDHNFKNLDENILLKIYDTIRYVKPIEKKWSTDSEVFDESSFAPTHCYSFWEKNEVCENCISTRASIEKKVFMKLEYSHKRIYMVTAVPMSDHDTDDRVIELIRDVTDENLLDSKDLLNEKVLLEKINNLNRELICDPLTKLYNRRFMDERLPYELVKSKTTKAPMGLIMADIDHFKKINDTYGHVVGDHVLMGLANLLKSSIRDTHDWIIRYGGEEFLLFISDANYEILMEKAEKIRALVENHIFSIDDLDLHITSSFGVFSVIPNQVDDISITKKYIDNADKALYHSKTTGRNKVSSYRDIE